MIEKVVMENEKKTSYAVIYDERLDYRTGKHYMKQKSFPTSEEAEMFLEELGSDNRELSILMETEQKGQQATKVLFNEYVEDWFYGEHAHVIKLTTFKVRQALLNKHIVPFFGDKYLHEINEQEIAELIAQKDREGYSKSTIGSVHNFLSTLFRSAVKKGYLDKNPVRFMNMVKFPNRIPVILSESEVEKLLEVAHSEGEGMMYEFEISSGVRLAEILALSWSDLDFERETITVNKNVVSGGDVKHEIAKLRRGYRTIPLPTHLMPKLQKHKEGQQLMKEQLGDDYHHELDLIFPKKDGGIQSTSTVRARFNRLVHKANIRKINFHDLRKTHATLLVKAGESPYQVSIRLGHKSIDSINEFVRPYLPISEISIHPFSKNTKTTDKGIKQE
ncbi:MULTISPECIES: tyrosine-type recombinase/integrase [Bacillaceae]|uniref:Tyrosine-type recombinase/integrase n=1 Tax=Evansella alkalicola TaxID=745819 RepID=A0ABS6JYI4_9BACI|nr:MULTISPECIES: site-specific integrase [Bacillaceae]MBU9723643.1 tyrosine-type recombinase/integrase [Bacillus alkalicola]